MTPADLILAIDNGTQSLKAIVFDLKGQLRNRVQVTFQPYVSPKPGWAEQDPDVFWDALCRACRSLWEDHKVPKEAIAGVALTTQRATVVNVDRNGTPLRPAILWLDQRKTPGLPPLKGPWQWLFKIIGQSDTIAYFRSEAEANWLATYQADVWDRTHKYLLLSGYLTYRLTGRFVDSSGCQVGYVHGSISGVFNGRPSGTGNGAAWRYAPACFRIWRPRDQCSARSAHRLPNRPVFPRDCP